MTTPKPPDNQLSPTDFPPLMKEAAVIIFWAGTARFASIPASWIPLPQLRWARQTMEQGDELLLLSAITLIGAMVIWISFSGYLTQVRQTPWQTLCTALSYLALSSTGTSWLIQNGGNAVVWILTNLNYIAHQRSEARGEARGRAEGIAEGEARGRDQERTELLDQLVQEGTLTPEQRAEKEAQRRANDAAQNSNHGRE